MELTFKEGEVVYVDTTAFRSISPQRWNVVFFFRLLASSPWLLQGTTGKSGFRVVGLPGDSISFEGSRLLIVTRDDLIVGSAVFELFSIGLRESRSR